MTSAIKELLIVPVSPQLRGTLLVAASGMLYGLIGYLGTEISSYHYTVENMLFWRFFMAMCWMFLFNKIFKAQQNQPLSRPERFSLFKVTLFSSLSYSLASLFYFFASKHIGTGLAMVVFFSFPVFVTLFAYVLNKSRLSKHTLISLAIVLMGLMLLKGHAEHTHDWIGIIFGIVAAFSFAIYVHGSQHVAKTIDSRSMTLLLCIGNTLFFFIISCTTNSFVIPDNTQTWIYILAIGVLATAIPIQLLLSGLKYISSVKASVLSVLEPIVTVLAGLVFLHEMIAPVQIVGVLVVLFGALLMQFEKLPNTEDVYDAKPTLYTT